MSEQQGIAGRLSAYKVVPSEVHVRDGWNPRFDFSGMEELTESVREYGVRVPIRVRRNADGLLELIDGERRLRAALAAGVETVPAIMDTKLDDVEALVLAVTANSGKPFLPLEEASALKRLKDAGLTYLEIANKVGRSDIYVMDRMKLLEAPDSVKEKITAGKLGTTIASEILNTVSDDTERERLAEHATKGPMERRQVRTELTAAKAAKGSRSAATTASKQIPKFIREMAAAELSNLEEEYQSKALWFADQVPGLIADATAVEEASFVYQLNDLLNDGELDVITKKTKNRTISHPVSLNLKELFLQVNEADADFDLPQYRAHEVIRLALLVGKIIGMRSIIGDE
jgi:ParB/RepB/Spo0J family partition protein